MRTVVRWVEEGALQMRAEDVGIRLHEVGDLADPSRQVIDRRGHEGDDGARRAMGAVHVAGGADRFDAVVERCAGAPVAVDVDEARRENGARSGDGLRVDDGIGIRPVSPGAQCRHVTVLEAHPGVCCLRPVGDETGRVDDC